MKLTICFANIRVIVPCGNGQLTVGELQEKACARYRKAIGKSTNYWVRIAQLESAVDGGILDWDDYVCDVVEDKDKLIAFFEEEDPQHSDLDLGSAAGSEDINTSQCPSVLVSPRITTNGGYGADIHKYSNLDQADLTSSSYKRDASLEVDVGTKALKSNTQVVVRKGNNFSLNKSSFLNSSSSTNQIEESMINGNLYDPRSPKFASNNHRSSRDSLSDEQNNNKPKNISELKGDKRDRERSYFRRNTSARQSMASGLSESVDNDDYFYNPINKYDYDYSHLEMQDSFHKLQNTNQKSGLPWFYKDSQEICLANDGSLREMKVVNYTDSVTYKFAGLLITSVDQSSRVGNESLLKQGDLVVEINGYLLMDYTFEDAKIILSDSLNHSEIQFRILPVEERDRAESDIMQSSTSPTRLSSHNPVISLTTATPPFIEIKPRTRTSHNSPSSFVNPSTSPTSQSSASAQESLSPKAPVIAQLSHDNLSSYTRKIGHRINIGLKKGYQGLGFSITTRDTMIGDSAPIYIKNILPLGSAVQDGRLHPGDRLLEVNGEDLSGRSQEDVVAMLRSIPVGSSANFVISRQIDNLPRKLKDDPDTDKVISEDNRLEFLTFEIALNDTGSAGLGISLKGNQSKKTKKDLGIFVKSVFHGGAAWQDGRLKSNDQLIQVNGHSLQGVNNHEAIDILRQSMSTEGNVRGMIQMLIARRKLALDGTSPRVSSEASSDLSDSIFDQFHSKSANELVSDIAVVENDNLNPTANKPSVTSSSSSEVLEQSRGQSPYNPDVVVTDEEWPSGSESHDPFSRESTMRQSISEKRRDAFQRIPYNSDSKSSKSKQHNDSDKKRVSSTNVEDIPKSNKSAKPAKENHSTPTHLPNKRKDLKQRNNNNSVTVESKVHSPNGFRKSISTESLVAENNNSTYFPQWNQPKALNRRDAPASDVGPTLGIAKSSSLESLQTAVESYVAENRSHTSNSIPRPVPKGVRGRVLNDSFRAALDKTYDMTSELPTLKPMATPSGKDVREDDVSSQHSSSEDSSRSRSNKKRQANKGSKLFGIFKINKNKRSQSNTRSPKLAENESHKRNLEATREEDFERMKRENERIRLKKIELRNKQAEERKEDKRRSQTRVSDYERPRPPSVPVTKMQATRDVDSKVECFESSPGRRSVDPSSMLHRGSKMLTATNYSSSAMVEKEEEEERPTTLSRNKKYAVVRDDVRRLKEAKNKYGSLPRQPRGTTPNVVPQEISNVASPERSATEQVYISSSNRKFDNREFYHRQKPTSARKSQSPYSSADPKLKESHVPAKVESKKRDKHNYGHTSLERRGRLSSHGDITRNGHSKNVGSKAQRYYHYREESPEPPPQTFYVVEGETQRKPPFSVVRRSTVTRNNSPPERIQLSPIHRHSIYTEQPTALNYYSTPRHPQSVTLDASHVKRSSRGTGVNPFSQDRELKTDYHKPAGYETNRDSVSPTNSEAAEHNRSAYHKIYGENLENSLGQVERSTPYYI